MTPTQTYTVAVIGGLTVIIGAIVLLLLATGIYLTLDRLTDARDRHRHHRRTRHDLNTCNAIHALGTTQPNR